MTTPTPPYGDLFADLTYSTVLPTGYASGYLMSDVASAALYSGWAPLMSPMFSGSVTVDGYTVINQYLDVSGSINASGSLSVSGSIYTSGAITASGSVTASGATSSGQLATLAQVQAQSTNYAPDTGMVNALAVTLTPMPTLAAGLAIRVKVANTITGPATLAVNGGVSYAIIDQSGSPLMASALLAMDIATFKFNGAAWVYHPTQGRLLNVQVFTTSGTYTPTPGTNSVIVEVQGAGGGGGGAAETGAGDIAIAYSGSGGSYGRGRFTSGFSGVAVTIGAVGLGGAAGDYPGTTGGTTSFGDLLICPGGLGGTGGSSNAFSAAALSPGTLGPAASTGANILSVPGGPAGQSIQLTDAGTGISSGSGGESYMGPGAQPGWGDAISGAAATSPGGGGSGAANGTASATGKAGGNGGAGIVIVREYA